MWQRPAPQCIEIHKKKYYFHRFWPSSGFRQDLISEVCPPQGAMGYGMDKAPLFSLEVASFILHTKRNWRPQGSHLIRLKLNWQLTGQSVASSNFILTVWQRPAPQCIEIHKKKYYFHRFWPSSGFRQDLISEVCPPQGAMGYGMDKAPLFSLEVASFILHTKRNWRPQGSHLIRLKLNWQLTGQSVASSNFIINGHTWLG